MIDWTKPIETTDGKPARVLGEITVPPGHDRKVIAYKGNDGFEALSTVPLDGVSWFRNKPAVQTVWVNAYDDDLVVSVRSRAEADEIADSDRLACLQITYTVGDGLDGKKPKRAQEAEALIGEIERLLPKDWRTTRSKLAKIKELL